VALQQDLETYSWQSPRRTRADLSISHSRSVTSGSPPHLRTAQAVCGDVRSALSGNPSWPVVPTAPVHVRSGLTERGRDLIVALRVLVRWGNATNRWADPQLPGFSFELADEGQVSLGVPVRHG